MSNCVIAAFYHFAPIEEPHAVKDSLEEALAMTSLRGTILLAFEGVNGTVAGSENEFALAINTLRALPGFSKLEYKISHAKDNPFYRLKIRLKKEIVAMGVADTDPTKAVGHYIEPEDWNQFVQDEDVVIVDTRNHYEVSIGTFEGAVDPQTESFREFPDWFRMFHQKYPNKKFAMFCTGGIRCEKATSFARAQGVDEVYHLKGGILKYLEKIPEKESLWRGECFVFDNRVSVTHGLDEGRYDMCHACRRPITADDKKSEAYDAGVSCPHCRDKTDARQRERFAERQKQISLSQLRGETHIGAHRPHHDAKNDKNG
ncbi:MAG: rhodanese-related sulfurtransferase [Pseudomonadota bacterium]